MSNLLDTNTSTTSAVPLWRNRDYLLLWSGQAVSSIGSNASELAMPLLTLALTHSPFQAGFVGTLHVIASRLIGLPAGALVDCWDRQRTMLVCDAGRALALATLPIALWLGWLTLFQLYMVSLLEGVLFVFFSTAQRACLPRIFSGFLPCSGRFMLWLPYRWFSGSFWPVSGCWTASMMSSKSVTGSRRFPMNCKGKLPAPID